MKIAVVIPAYNAEAFLEETLNSVRHQSYENWSAVVIDDGSTDATYDIAKRIAGADARFKVFRQRNGDVSSARNSGLGSADADADAISLLDHDDLLEPNAFELLVRSLTNDSNAFASHGRFRSINSTGDFVPEDEVEKHFRVRKALRGRRIRELGPTEPTGYSSIVLYNPLVSPGVALVRKSSLGKVGFFDTALKACGDWDMWLRMSEYGHIAFVDSPVLRYRRHASNVSNQTDLMEAETRQILSRIGSISGRSMGRVRMAQYASQLPMLDEAAVRWEWTKGALRDGKVAEGMKQFRHAVIQYVRFQIGAQFGGNSHDQPK